MTDLLTPTGTAVDDVLEARGADRTTAFGLYLCPADDPLVPFARSVERAVFFEAFGNTEATMAAEYGPYEAASVWAVVVDHTRGEVAGCIRFITDGAGTVKSIADIGNDPWSADVDATLAAAGVTVRGDGDVLDVATLSVAPDYRGEATSGIVSLALYQAVCRLSWLARNRYFVAVLDCVVFESVQRRTGAPFQHYPGIEPARYLDSPLSIPVFADVDEYRTRLERDDPALHELLFDAVGFESVISPPDWAAGALAVVDASAATVIDLTGRPTVHDSATLDEADHHM